MYISVIIPTYNRVKTLQKCLDHIINQSISINNYEVIVVDDCSKDSTWNYFNDLPAKYKNVTYIRNESNKGLATTRNVGISASKGSILIFLDNDLLVNHTFLENHLKCHKNNDKIAVVSDITYEPDMLKKTNFGSFIQSRAIGYRSNRNMHNIKISDLPGNFFAGGGSSCKREDAFRIGLFEENLKKYGSEDELFGHRLKKENIKIIFCPEAKIIHYDRNILPKYWKTKYVELGRYSLKYLAESEYSLLSNSLIRYLLNVNWKKDNLKLIFFKMFFSLVSSSLFRLPVEKFVFITDSCRILYFPILYRYLTMAWIKSGYKTDKKIHEVEY